VSHICSSRAQKKKPHEANRTEPNQTKQTTRQTKEHSYNNAVHKALLRLMQLCLTTKLTKARGVTKHMRSECRHPPPPWNQAHRRSTTSSFKPKSLRYMLLELRAHQRSSFAAATDKRKRQVHHNNTSSSPLYFILKLCVCVCVCVWAQASEILLMYWEMGAEAEEILRKMQSLSGKTCKILEDDLHGNAKTRSLCYKMPTFFSTTSLSLSLSLSGYGVQSSAKTTTAGVLVIRCRTNDAVVPGCRCTYYIRCIILVQRIGLSYCS
jgi:hypothetical protein